MWGARINIPIGFRLQITCLSFRVGLCICGRHFDYHFKQKRTENDRTNLLCVSTVSKHHAVSLLHTSATARLCVESMELILFPCLYWGLVRVLVHAGPNFNSSNRYFPLYPTTLRTLPVRDVPQRASNCCYCSHDPPRPPTPGLYHIIEFPFHFHSILVEKM